MIEKPMVYKMGKPNKQNKVCAGTFSNQGKTSLVLSDQLTGPDYSKGQTRKIMLPGDTHTQGKVANIREQQGGLNEVDEELEDKMLRKFGKGQFYLFFFKFIFFFLILFYF